MARILVQDDNNSDVITLDERNITPDVIEDTYAKEMLLERITWAISDIPLVDQPD